MAGSSIILAVAGESRCFGIRADFIPPVGTRFTADKHLIDGGTTYLLEVVRHEWRVEQTEDDGGFSLQLTLHTKKVRHA